MDVSRAELALAWKRYRRDLSDRCFVDHPHMVEWIECDLDGWLDQLGAKLAAGYNPQAARRCSVPKAGSMIRPGSVLEPEDATVYTYLVGRAYERIRSDVKGNEGKTDVAYRTSSNFQAVEWTKHDFKVWQEWRKKSMAALKLGIRFVVVSDITGFYDNISIQKLVDELRRVDVDEEVLVLLQSCLRKWSTPRDEGIPQGYSASDLIAKLYLSPVDRQLARAGYQHLRYVDDHRIFCASRLDARKAIWLLSKQLFTRGLTLQSGKTEILSKSEARTFFDGVSEIIDELNERTIADLQRDTPDGSALRPSQVAAALAERGGPPPPVLERAFEEYFGVGSSEKFKTSLFHYLLVRLGAARSRIAIPYCIDALRARPEETEYILGYFSNIELESSEQLDVVDYMGSEDAIYDYQLFQILRWLLGKMLRDDGVLDLARVWARDRNRDPWLRSYALAYWGRFGDASDRDEISEAYAESTNDIERCDRVAAVRRMERSRRNAFYGRVAADGMLVARAVAIAKRASHSSKF